MKRVKNKFSIIFPLLSIIGIACLTVLSSFYEKSWTHNWENVSKQIKDSVLYARNVGYTGGFGSDGRSMKKSADTRYWVMQNATNDELLNLLKYPDGTVRALGYEGLIKKTDFNYKTELILKSIDDNEYGIFYSMGCLSERLEISEYLIQILLKIDDKTTPFKPELIVDYGLSEVDKEKILKKFYNRNSTL